VVVDLERKVKITREILHTVTPWTIYDGWEATGWPVMTLVHGHIVMEWPQGEPRARISDASPGEYQRRKLARSA
jgi:dihydroorotase-like cyclic amidohydrolase